MIALARKRGGSCWFVCPRNELIRQSSETLKLWGIPHGLITAESQESRAFDVHIVSKDTLTRRLDKIENWPMMVFYDEAHVAHSGQLKIEAARPEGGFTIGVTATPERLDQKGLNDIYQTMIEGPSISDLISQGYLSPMRYFSPPISGLENVKRRGNEYDADELDVLLKKNQVYGQAIRHYRKIADGRPAIVYCRNVKAAKETAVRFCDAGYNFAAIDGRQSKKHISAVLDGVRSGKLDGVTSCDLVTYGLDLPRCEVIIMLRPTMSTALFYQMVGRGLRVSPGKKAAIILDHVGNLRTHGHPLQDRVWRFEGGKRRSLKGESADTLKLCLKCFLYHEGAKCPHCGHQNDPKQQKKFEEIDGRLVEIKGPVPLKKRSVEDRDEYAARRSSALARSDTAELCKLASEIGNNIMSVYWELSQGRHSINETLLHELSRVGVGLKGGPSTPPKANGWRYSQRKLIAERLGRK
jgi:superfamily II DNA or RNA helicase